MYKTVHFNVLANRPGALHQAISGRSFTSLRTSSTDHSLLRLPSSRLWHRICPHPSLAPCLSCPCIPWPWPRLQRVSPLRQRSVASLEMRLSEHLQWTYSRVYLCASLVSVLLSSLLCLFSSSGHNIDLFLHFGGCFRGISCHRCQLAVSSGFEARNTFCHLLRDLWVSACTVQVVPSTTSCG